MITRIIIGAVLIAALSGLMYLDWMHEQAAVTDDYDWPERIERLPIGLLTGVIVLLLAVAAFREIARLAKAHGFRVSWGGGMLGTLLLVWLPIALRGGAPSVMTRPLIGALIMFIVILTVLLAFAEQMIARGNTNALPNVGVTLLAVTYLGAGLALLLDMRIFCGIGSLVVTLGAVKCTDIGAYFTGSLIGRHKLVPKISPGKTWEGLLGGLAMAAGATMLAGWLLEIPVSLTALAIFGVVLGLFGQFGDLCESALKRSAGVKDSGAVLPQFGGILDILDSPLLAAPAAWVFMTGVALA